MASWQAFPPRMTISISTQGAHAARDHFAALLKLPVHAVRVLVGDVGGAFGQKIQVGREEGAVVLAARLVDRPIKWVEDRWENLIAAPHAREERGTVSMALDPDGTITAMRIEHSENSGSYGRVVGGDMVPRLITGPYRIEQVGRLDDARPFEHVAAAGVSRPVVVRDGRPGDAPRDGRPPDRDGSARAQAAQSVERRRYSLHHAIRSGVQTTSPPVRPWSKRWPCSTTRVFGPSRPASAKGAATSGSAFRSISNPRPCPLVSGRPTRAPYASTPAARSRS